MPGYDPRRMVVQAPWDDRTPVTYAPELIRVLVRPRFADGWEGDAEGLAGAWSPRAVQVAFSHPDPRVPTTAYRVWLPIERVQRLQGPARRHWA